MTLPHHVVEDSDAEVVHREVGFLRSPTHCHLDIVRFRVLDGVVQHLVETVAHDVPHVAGEPVDEGSGQAEVVEHLALAQSHIAEAAAHDRMQQVDMTGEGVSRPPRRPSAHQASFAREHPQHTRDVLTRDLRSSAAQHVGSRDDLTLACQPEDRLDKWVPLKHYLNHYIVNALPTRSALL